MANLLMLRGLPASGKSTHAMELVKKGWKRVNKDDIRAMIDGGKWSRKNEKNILDIEIGMVYEMLSNGYNVVVDDTNFAHEKTWRGVAEKLDAHFMVKDFEVPFSECIERDAGRGDKSVGATVIQRMYDKYLKPEKVSFQSALSASECCYIFDIDGTLAHSNGRSPYDLSRVREDKEDQDVTVVLDELHRSGNKIIIMSGRDSSCMEETESWLKEHGIHYDHLYMRQEGDRRKDSIIKMELYEANVKGKYIVLGVFDDRNQVVDLWRSLGLTCFQVGYGNF